MATVLPHPAPAAPRNGAATREPPRMVWNAAQRVRLFEHDPDLLSGVEPAKAEILRLRVTAAKRCVEAGPVADDDPALEPSCLGLLIVEGLLIRSVRLHGLHCPELLGPGDVVRPWDHDEDGASVDHGVTWRALEPTTFADLDEHVASVVGRFPPILQQLHQRAARRTRMLAFQHAVAHVRHADRRLMLLLWHLADSWGRVTADGALVPLCLTHELLADLACMRRPTASSALRRLADEGAVARTDEGHWLLLQPPPQA